MPYFSAQTLERVRNAVDLLTVVQDHVDMRRSGPDRYVGLCPFHAERTPSFTVSPEKGFYYCFGCQASGDVFRFVQNTQNVSFPEAVRLLAQRAGVDLPEEEGPRDGTAITRERRELLKAVIQRASELYEERLWDNEGLPVRNYLRSRGVTNDVVQSFRLGFSPGQWDWLARKLLFEKFPEDALVDAGLARRRDIGGLYDVFRGRLMIPVQDARGNAVAFAGRILDIPGLRPQPVQSEDGGPPREPAKYVNSDTTPVFNKGKILFGMHQAAPFLEAAGMIFIVEGYFDLIALHSAGVHYAVAAMGTAFPQTQVNLLRGSGLEIYLLFDGDAAGREAAKKALPKLQNASLDGRAVILPEEHDPDTFVRKYGPEALMSLAEAAPTALDYACDCIVHGRGDSPGAQAAAVDDSKIFLREVTDPAKAEILRNALASRLGISPDSLPIGVKARLESPPQPAGTSGGPGAPFVRDGQPGQRLEPAVENLLELALSNPFLMPLVERLDGRWPDGHSESLAGELLKLYREDGTVQFSKLFDLFREGPAGGMIARAAAMGPALNARMAEMDALIFLKRILEVSNKARLKELASEFRAAESQGNLARLAAIREQRADLQREIDELHAQLEDLRYWVNAPEHLGGFPSS